MSTPVSKSPVNPPPFQVAKVATVGSGTIAMMVGYLWQAADHPDGPHSWLAVGAILHFIGGVLLAGAAAVFSYLAWKHMQSQSASQVPNLPPDPNPGSESAGSSQPTGGPGPNDIAPNQAALGAKRSKPVTKNRKRRGPRNRRRSRHRS